MLRTTEGLFIYKPTYLKGHGGKVNEKAALLCYLDTDTLCLPIMCKNTLLFHIKNALPPFLCIPCSPLNLPCHSSPQMETHMQPIRKIIKDKWQPTRSLSVRVGMGVSGGRGKLDATYTSSVWTPTNRCLLGIQISAVSSSIPQEGPEAAFF